MSVLVVAAHYDDEILGCGGTLARWTKEGHEAHVLSCSWKTIDSKRVTERENEEYQSMSKCACACVGVKDVRFLRFMDERFWEARCRWELLKQIEKYAEEIEASTVLTHSANDYNQDHRVLNEVCRIAFRPYMDVKKLLFFEVLSATGLEFSPAYFVSLAEYEVKRKMEGWSCYDIERRDDPHPRSDSALHANIRLRGSQVGVMYAEAFEIGFIRE